jgi:hypothetical protein
MSTYAPPDPTAVDALYHSNRESKEQFQRLKDSPADLLRQVLTDRAAPVEARANALGILLQRRHSGVIEILPDLFEDPELGHQAIRYYPLTGSAAAAFPGCKRDANARERIRSFLDHASDRVWSAAAMALARAKDHELLPRLLDWFHKGDQGHRNVAIEGLIELDAADAARLFRESWENGGRDKEDQLVLGRALLRLGDTCALDLMEDAARRAEGSWSVFAATSIAGHDGARGLRLMLWVLDHGDAEALSSLVMHAWNVARLPHAFTVDGIHETRLWVEQQMNDRKDWALYHLGGGITV